MLYKEEIPNGPTACRKTSAFFSFPSLKSRIFAATIMSVIRLFTRPQDAFLPSTNWDTTSSTHLRTYLIYIAWVVLLAVPTDAAFLFSFIKSLTLSYVTVNSAALAPIYTVRGTMPRYMLRTPSVRNTFQVQLRQLPYSFGPGNWAIMRVRTTSMGVVMAATKAPTLTPMAMVSRSSSARPTRRSAFARSASYASR